MPSVLMQIADRRLIRHFSRQHAGDIWEPVAFAQIAARAGGHDIFPGRRAALGPRYDVIEGKVVARPAILAGEAIAQENIEPRKGGMA